MQPVLESPGFAFESDSIDEPESLSEIVTVPAVNALPGFDVVLENAESVPVPATEPATPTTRSDSSTFRTRSMSGPRGAGVELEADVLDRALVAGRRGREPHRDLHLRGSAGTQGDGLRAPSAKGTDGPAEEDAAACGDPNAKRVVQGGGRGKGVDV